jgi:hypothetical protein
MNATIQLSFDQLLQLVMQLPGKQKQKLISKIQKESYTSSVLTNELKKKIQLFSKSIAKRNIDEDMIIEEVKKVRKNHA